MIQEFLNYVDEMTDFGRIHFKAETLFEGFVGRKRLSPNVAYGFRLRLQRKGIL